MSGKLIKKLLIVVGILLLIAGGLAYYFFQSPLYSMYRIKTAIEEHDIKEFETYFATDSVLGSITDQMIDMICELSEERMLEEYGDEEALVKYETVWRRQMLKSIKKTMVLKMKRQLYYYIRFGRMEKRKLDTDGATEIIAKVWEHYKGTFDQSPGIDHFRTDSDTAWIGLSYDIGQEKAVIEFRLHKNGDHWQIVDIPNFGNFAKSLLN